jgi:hypothetical protein
MPRPSSPSCTQSREPTSFGPRFLTQSSPPSIIPRLSRKPIPIRAVRASHSSGPPFGRPRRVWRRVPLPVAASIGRQVSPILTRPGDGPGRGPIHGHKNLQVFFAYNPKPLTPKRQILKTAFCKAPCYFPIKIPVRSHRCAGPLSVRLPRGSRTANVITMGVQP